jgi:hypothetical protein
MPARLGARIERGSTRRKPNIGRKDDPVLTILRRVLRDSRAVAKHQGIPDAD